MFIRFTSLGLAMPDAQKQAFFAPPTQMLAIPQLAISAQFTLPKDVMDFDSVHGNKPVEANGGSWESKAAKLFDVLAAAGKAGSENVKGADAAPADATTPRAIAARLTLEANSAA